MFSWDPETLISSSTHARYLTLTGPFDIRGKYKCGIGRVPAKNQAGILIFIYSGGRMAHGSQTATSKPLCRTNREATFLFPEGEIPQPIPYVAGGRLQTVGVSVADFMP